MHKCVWIHTEPLAYIHLVGCACSRASERYPKIHAIGNETERLRVNVVWTTKNVNTQNENTTTSTSRSKRFYFYARFRLVSPLPLRSSAQPMSLFYCYSCNYYCYSVDVHRTILLYRRRQRRHQRIVHISKISRETQRIQLYIYI